MEVDEAQTQASKFSRVGANGKIDGGSSILGVGDGDGGRQRSWQHSSRIIRVSRASGGKDRHSKVWTAKGTRDRRVRLSVATAIQFYDLQDRLGVDQPSKAVEWLIKAAADAISELPSLDAAFPETPRQISDEKRPGLGGGGGGNTEQGFDSSAEIEIDGDPGFAQRTSNLSRSSACSSNSETSKGSGGLSLSRNEIRVKARERARERTAKEKETESTTMVVHGGQHQQQMNENSSSFTQLLTAGIGNTENAGVSSNSPMGYFNATRGGGFSGQMIQLGNSGMHQAMMAAVSTPFSVGGEHQHFPFIPDHHLASAASGGSGGDHYNLNFSISPSSSSGLAAGFNNRGTLQSNSSQSLLPHQLQRFSSSPLDGTNVPFFLGAPVENHQHHGGTTLFPPGLQLYYGDNGGRQSDQKGKGKP